MEGNSRFETEEEGEEEKAKLNLCESRRKEINQRQTDQRSLFGERYSKWIYNLEKKAKIGLAKRTYEMKGSGAI